ncbi:MULTISPECIES: hypothetical protein [Butyribacter]|jgi:hypothetical protein|uniref:hypothetical protein n=1 Tax=Butyribacter TaxID=2822463 RepID=UPI00399FF76D
MTDVMTDKEEKILKTFAIVLPKLSESDKSYLLGLGEGMVIRVNEQKEEKR